MTAACPVHHVASLKSGIHSPPVLVKKGVRTHRVASGFSRPPFCRIAPHTEGWMLELEPGMSGMWLHDQAERCKTFASLVAAINYAVARGWRYRVVHAAPAAPAPINVARGRSAWL